MPAPMVVDRGGTERGQRHDDREREQEREIPRKRFEPLEHVVEHR
jgi:hypothetical protein